MSNSSSSSSGVGFVGLLTVLFVGLKLTDHIDWSWWWVLSPMWISLLILVVLDGYWCWHSRRLDGLPLLFLFGFWLHPVGRRDSNSHE